MQKHLPYIIGSGTVVAAALLTCYCKREQSSGKDCAVPEPDRQSNISDSLFSGVFEDADGTVTLKTATNPTLTATTITLSSLKQLLKGVPGQETIYTVAEELYKLKCGGVLIVVYDCKGGKNPEATMPVKSLAGGKLRNAMRQYARTLFVDDSEGASVNPNFLAMLRGFCSVDMVGTHADKWTKPVLESMAADLGESWDTADTLRLLQNEPADGAFAILSLRGTVVGASSRIDITPQHVIHLSRFDGKGTGTKHSAAVSAVEWCRLKKLQGAAVVRSEVGRVTFVGIEGIGKKQTRAYEIVGL